MLRRITSEDFYLPLVRDESKLHAEVPVYQGQQYPLGGSVSSVALDPSAQVDTWGDGLKAFLNMISGVVEQPASHSVDDQASEATDHIASEPLHALGAEKPLHSADGSEALQLPVGHDSVSAQPSTLQSVFTPADVLHAPPLATPLVFPQILEPSVSIPQHSRHHVHPGDHLAPGDVIPSKMYKPSKSTSVTPGMPHTLLTPESAVMPKLSMASSQGAPQRSVSPIKSDKGKGVDRYPKRLTIVPERHAAGESSGTPRLLPLPQTPNSAASATSSVGSTSHISSVQPFNSSQYGGIIGRGTTYQSAPQQQVRHQTYVAPESSQPTHSRRGPVVSQQAPLPALPPPPMAQVRTQMTNPTQSFVPPQGSMDFPPPATYYSPTETRKSLPSAAPQMARRTPSRTGTSAMSPPQTTFIPQPQPHTSPYVPTVQPPQPDLSMSSQGVVPSGPQASMFHDFSLYNAVPVQAPEPQYPPVEWGMNAATRAPPQRGNKRKAKSDPKEQGGSDSAGRAPKKRKKAGPSQEGGGGGN